MASCELGFGLGACSCCDVICVTEEAENCLLTFHMRGQNPILKSQLTESSERVFKFCARFLKDVNISRTRWDINLRNKRHFVGKETDIARYAVKCCRYPYCGMQQMNF